MATVSGLMTAEEFAAFVECPENADRLFELDEGKVVEFPLPRQIHGFVCANVGYHLGTYCFQRNPRFMATMRCGVIVSRDPDTVLGPDVSLFHNTKSWGELIAEQGYGDDVPHLVVEVFSPTGEQGGIQRKIRQYLRGGVKLVWVIDPSVREVTVYRRGADPEFIASDGEVTGGDTLPGLAIRVAELFDKPGTSH